MTVEDVLQQARERHPAFNKNWTPDPLVRRWLETYQQGLLARLAQVKRDALSLVWEVEVPSADAFSEASWIPDHIRIHGGTVVFSNDADPEELELLDFAERNVQTRPWSAYVQGNGIVLRGAAIDWGLVDRIDLYYFPRGGTLSANTSTFDLPGQAMGVLASGAAWFLATRAPKEVDPPVSLQQFAAERKAAETSWMEEATGSGAPSIGIIREEW